MLFFIICSDMFLHVYVCYDVELIKLLTFELQYPYTYILKHTDLCILFMCIGFIPNKETIRCFFPLQN